MSSNPFYLLGIDIGQAVDPTALALLEYDLLPQPVYRLRALNKFPLNTPYTELPAAIKKRLTVPPLLGRTRLAVDATGVGAPMIDYFRAHLPGIALYAITITGGTSVTGTSVNPNVPKRDLISTTSVLLEQQRLRIAAAMPNCDDLTDELVAYRRTTSEKGNESYAAAAGSHDDLVLALSLALWTAENRPVPRPPRRYKPVQARIPTYAEIAETRYRWHHS